MKSIFTILLSALSLTGFSQNWNEIIKTVASDRAGTDQFGYSVSISGDKAIVGAFLDWEDATGGNSQSYAGSAYIFELNGGIWSQTAKLVPSDRAMDDQFGRSVSISGDKVIVGALYEDEDDAGSNTLSKAGSAYIFELSGGVWTETAKLVASDRGVNDQFGRSVSISGDRVIVGAWYENHNALGSNTLSDAGSAYVFELNGGVWYQRAKLVASDRGVNDLFGASVSISGDKAVVGAFYEDEDAVDSNTLTRAGSVYVFELNGINWPQTAKLVASDRGVDDQFGTSVSISGDKVIVGAYQEDEDAAGANTLSDAGSAYVFELNGGAWSQTAKLIASDRTVGDSFGFSVSISGNKAVVGAYNEDEDATGANTLLGAGSAYIFELSGGTWSQNEKLVASDRWLSDSFGYSVSISGGRVLVGAYQEDEDATGGNSIINAGSAYIFHACANTVNITTTLTGNSISANAIGVSYQWIDCDNGNIAIPSQTNQTYTATSNGNYAVIVNNGNCTDTSTCISIIGLGINELDKYNLNLYPNPTTGNITIDLSELNNSDVSIINSIGIEVFNAKNVTQNKLVISLADFNNGIYFVKVQNGNEIVTQKIIKQ